MPRRKKMMIISLATALVLFIIALGAWWYLFFGRANSPLVNGQLSINNATFDIEIASTTLEQTRGLSFRPSLGANDGMLFIFGAGGVQSFWMKDMNFPLDMIWISGTTVVGFAQNVPAPASSTALWSLPVYTSPNNTDKVLEVNAGTVAKYNIRVGDAVRIGATK
jgi:uncharacterized membrane protein (UPF0127 family)